MNQLTRQFVTSIDATSMLRLYGVDAESVAQLKVDASIRAGDTDTALAMDRVRRQIIAWGSTSEAG